MSKKKSLTRTLVIMLLTAIVLYLLFMPKYGGYEHYDVFYGPGIVLEEQKCTCFGIEVTDLTNTSFEAKEFKCYGIPVDCHPVCKTFLGRIKVDTDCP